MTKEIVLMQPSKKASNFVDFADSVIEHLEKYVVPQYGDEGEDLAADYTVEDCLKQAQKYINRHGRNSRPGQDKLDMLKAAHYIQMAWSKMQ